MDANFKLRLQKGKTKRSDDDPELEPGWLAFAEEEAYQVMIKKYGSTKEV
jgi:hypothetical protein